MSARQTADHIETGLAYAAMGAWLAGERAIADARMRRSVLAHNQRVAAIGAARARKRAAAANAAKQQLGAELMARYLRDRELLGD